MNRETDDDAFERWRSENPDVWDAMIGKTPTNPRPAHELMHEALMALGNPAVIRELQRRAA